MCGYINTELHTLSYDVLDDKHHREYCTSCTYSKVQYHDYECTGSVDGIHTEVCRGCGYSHSGLTNAQYTSIDENNHSSVCIDCGYYISAESHQWKYTSVSDSYHEGYCQNCGVLKDNYETHTWETYSPQYVKCMYCGHLKLKTGNIIIPVSSIPKNSDEEIE